MIDLGTFIAVLHDNEINGEISWFFDPVWTVKPGDRRNGYDAEAVVSSLGEAAEWLRATAIPLHRDSTFAQRYDHLPRPADDIG